MIISHVRADLQGSDSHFEPSVAFRFHLPNGNARLVNRVTAGWHAEYLRSRNLGESTSLDHSRWLSKPNDQSILLERRTRWNTPKPSERFVVPRGLRSSIHGIGITSSLIGWHRFREQITESASSICARVRKLIDARPCPIA